MRWLLALILVIGGCAASAAQTPCDAAAPCAVANGDYYLSFPPDWDGVTPLPSLVFFHGHNSSGLSVINSGGIHAAFTDRGYLIVAPNGAILPGRDVRAWPARPTTSDYRDDVDFTLEVLDDVARRVPLDDTRILVAGFSAGGSMAWMMACYEGARFSGFVSVAGALRRPAPAETCPGGPVRMLQIHGFADTQVPLEGRGIRDWHQGDVFESLALLRNTNSCRSNPTAIDMGADYWCRSWTGCDGGADIRFCLHDGGHGLPQGWPDLAREWFESEPGES